MPTPSLPPKSRRQIAAEYQISSDTLRRRLRRMKIAIPNGLILPAHQRQVYERLGYPAGVDPADYAEIPLPEEVEKEESDRPVRPHPRPRIVHSKRSA